MGTCTSVLTEMLAIAEQMDIEPDAEAIAEWWKQIDQWRADKGIYTASRYEARALEPASSPRM